MQFGGRLRLSFLCLMFRHCTVVNGVSCLRLSFLCLMLRHYTVVNGVSCLRLRQRSLRECHSRGTERSNSNKYVLNHGWINDVHRQQEPNSSDNSSFRDRCPEWIYCGTLNTLAVELLFRNSTGLRIRKVSTLYSANVTDGNILLTERTHNIIKLTYSTSARA